MKKTIITILLVLVTMVGQAQSPIPESFDFKEGDGKGAFVIRNISVK